MCVCVCVSVCVCVCVCVCASPESSTERGVAAEGSRDLVERGFELYSQIKGRRGLQDLIRIVLRDRAVLAGA